MNKLVLWTKWLEMQAKSERGAGLAEYAVLVVLIAVPMTVVVTAFANDLIAAFNAAIAALPGTGGP